MTCCLLLGVDVATIFRFFEALESERAALSAGTTAWSSIISSEGYGKIDAV